LDDLPRRPLDEAGAKPLVHRVGPAHSVGHDATSSVRHVSQHAMVLGGGAVTACQDGASRRWSPENKETGISPTKSALPCSAGGSLLASSLCRRCVETKASTDLPARFLMRWIVTLQAMMPGGEFSRSGIFSTTPDIATGQPQPMTAGRWARRRRRSPVARLRAAFLRVNADAQRLHQWDLHGRQLLALYICYGGRSGRASRRRRGRRSRASSRSSWSVRANRPRTRHKSCTGSPRNGLGLEVADANAALDDLDRQLVPENPG
jgi:hypothetical protein